MISPISISSHDNYKSTRALFSLMALSLSLRSGADDNYDPGIMKPTKARGNDLLLDVNHIVALWIMVCLIRAHVNRASINNPVPVSVGLKWENTHS